MSRRIIKNHHWEQVFTDIIQPTETEPWGFVITQYSILLSIYDTIDPTTGKNEKDIHQVIKKRVIFFINEDKETKKT